MCSPDFDNERKARLLSCWYVLHLFTHTHIHSDATSRCFPQNKCASFAVIPCLYQATGTATREDDEDKPLRVETTTDSGCLTHVSALPQPKKKKSNHSLRDSRTGGTYPSILSSRWREGAVEIHDSLNWFHVGADWGGHQDKAQAKQVRWGYSNKRRLTLTFVWVHPCAEVT